MIGSRHPAPSLPTEDVIPADVNGDYDASAITVLEGLEAVRKRPGMYIGSTGERGLHHLITEIVDNAVDEALAGYCDRIVLTLRADGGVQVIDNGRGIPTDTAPGQELPAVTMALTLLHAGGKFGGGGYKVSGGLHGVGVSVVNALSTVLVVEVKNRGHLWRQSFQLGVPDAPLEQIRPLEDGEGTGTTVTWWASEDIFETTTYNLETLTNRMREYAFLNKGLEIVIRDERPTADELVDAVEDDTVAAEVDETGADAIKRADTGGLERVFKYDLGLVDYVAHLNRSKTPANPTIISFEADAPEGAGQHMSLEVAMQWNTSYTESVHTFANTINTHEGGTHEEGFRAALTGQINSFGEANNLIKKREDRVSGDDIREGLTAIVSIKMAEPQFEGQTKTKLGNTEAKGFTQRTVNDQLGAWLEANPAEGKEIVRKSQAAASARMAARNARDLARKRQGPDRRRRPAGQAVGLPVDQPRGVRGLHRRGRLGRWLRTTGSRPAHPGDPADPRQDPQRREGPHRQGPRQRRGPVDHLRARHRHPRRVQHRQAALPQGRADGRRRRRRPPHQHPAADAAVPVHAATDRGRLRLHGPAPALPAALEQAGRARVRLLRRRARRVAARRPGQRQEAARRRTRSSATRASAR